MRIHNLYTDASIESRLRDVEVEWVQARQTSKLSRTFPATGVIFRQVKPTYDTDWHHAPRRQYIVNLDAEVKLQTPGKQAKVMVDEWKRLLPLIRW